MTVISNPPEVAREALRQLAIRRMPPTPDNYRTLYHEIAGIKEADEAFPEKHLRALASALPTASPDQMRLARQLDEAAKNSDWEAYRNCLVDFVTVLCESQKLAWSGLISDLLRAWESRQAGITPARKREALDHILNSASASPEILFTRLQSLLRSWSGSEEAHSDLPPEAGDPAAVGSPAHAEPPPIVVPGRPGELLGELRELFAFTLETAIAAQLLDSPQLSSDARNLASEIRKAFNQSQLQEFLTRLKRFAFRLELHYEDQAELRRSLLGLLRLLVENTTELVMDDPWLHGQIELVRDIIDQPLSQRMIDDAERRLKEVLYKQSQLKHSLHEAKEAIKLMLAGFVDHLAEFAAATSGYHDKIEACAARISAADNISELEDVVGEVMRETRAIQFNTLRSRDELTATQERVRQAEMRIQELESELERTSQLVRHDQLTGVLNRRGLDEIFDKEIDRARRRDHDLCVALLDIDNFKKLNDSLGHEAGDQALIHLATVCRKTLRPQDTVARYGGEEFLILLPETGIDDAGAALTRLQRELTRQIFLYNNRRVLITFSAGVTKVMPEDSPASAIKRADQAMYQAKEAGRNRVVALPGGPSEALPSTY